MLFLFGSCLPLCLSRPHNGTRQQEAVVKLQQSTNMPIADARKGVSYVTVKAVSKRVHTIVQQFARNRAGNLISPLPLQKLHLYGSGMIEQKELLDGRDAAALENA